MRRPKRFDNPNQLDLFAVPPAFAPPVLKATRVPGVGFAVTFERPPPELPPPVVELVAPAGEALTRQSDGYFRVGPVPEGPYSRWMGSAALSAVESYRAMCGLSLDVGGVLLGDEPHCPRCVRYLWTWGARGVVHLFAAEAVGRRRVAAECFVCSNCNASFRAHRDEHEPRHDVRHERTDPTRAG